jgi:hypothetical protein
LAYLRPSEPVIRLSAESPDFLIQIEATIEISVT